MLPESSSGAQGHAEGRQLPLCSQGLRKIRYCNVPPLLSESLEQELEMLPQMAPEEGGQAQPRNGGKEIGEQREENFWVKPAAPS